VQGKEHRDSVRVYEVFVSGSFVARPAVEKLRLFVTNLSPRVEWAVIREGLPAKAAWAPLESLGLSTLEISRVVGISEKTMRRKESKAENLAVAEADRTMRLMRITSEAAEAIGDLDKALIWMRSPSRFLGGKTPLEMIETEGGVGLVRQSLGAIAYGGVA
jgi:putative toxin-antitoxin system antitoxin component (TIGR02293 family)